MCTPASVSPGVPRSAGQRSGGQHEPVVGDRRAVGQRNGALARIDARHLTCKAQIDITFGIPGLSLDVHRVRLDLAAQEALRERWTVYGGRVSAERIVTGPAPPAALKAVATRAPANPPPTITMPLVICAPVENPCLDRAFGG